MTVALPETRPVEAPPKTTADVLRHAALLIEERGWMQGVSTGPSRCAVFAIDTAAGANNDVVHWRAHRVLASYLGLNIPDVVGDRRPIVEWNDTPGRTAAEVIAALRAAAEMAS
jgi:hypothetical protein